MDVQIWLIVGLAFLGGGTLGSLVTLTVQWVLGRLGHGRSFDKEGNRRTVRMLQGKLRELGNQVANLEGQCANVDIRLDFAEKLLGGSLTASAAPERMVPGPWGGAGRGEQDLDAPSKIVANPDEDSDA